MIVLLLLLYVVISPFYRNEWTVYDGGGILLSAYCPWFILLVISLKKINFLNLTLVLAMGILGFFLKASFTSIFAGALLYLLLTFSISPGPKTDIRRILLNAIFLGITLVAYILVIRFAFLSRGINIMGSSSGHRFQIGIIAFPLVAPVFGVFSFDRLIHSYQWVVGCIAVLPVYYFILKSRHVSLHYKQILVSFILTCFCFYALIYFLNYDVSYELRHYTVISILLIPAIFLLFNGARAGKYIFVIFIIAYLGFNTFDFVSKFRQSKDYMEGLGAGSIPGYSADILNQVHLLDDQNKNNGKDIFYFASDNPAVALEVVHNRVLLADNFVNFHFNNKAKYRPVLYYGRNSGEIYIIYSLAKFKADSALYLTRFEKYGDFKKIYQSAGFAIFKAIPR